MTGSSDACIAQTQCANARECPRAGGIWESYTPLNRVLGYQPASGFLVSYTRMQQQQTAYSKSMRISAVCADRTTQWKHLKCTSIDISSRINWDGKAEASIPNVRAETKSKVNRLSSFKAEQGKKSFALQSLHVIHTEQEYLWFIRVK